MQDAATNECKMQQQMYARCSKGGMQDAHKEPRLQHALLTPTSTSTLPLTHTEEHDVMNGIHGPALCLPHDGTLSIHSL